MRKERPVKRKAKDGTSSHRSSPLSYQTLTLRFLLPLHRWGEEGNISHSPLQPSLHPTQSCCLYIYYHTRSSTMCTSLLVSFGGFPTMTIFGFNHYLCTFLFSLPVSIFVTLLCMCSVTSRGLLFSSQLLLGGVKTATKSSSGNIPLKTSLPLETAIVQIGQLLSSVRLMI